MNQDWAYGITTVPSRRTNVFERTLASLRSTGFTRPRLFIDGGDASHYSHYGLEISTRNPPLFTYGNWVISAWELYQRNPHSKRFAIFQDDFICVRNLRRFLDRTKIPERGYLNLYMAPYNAKTKQGEKAGAGWYQPRLRGRGALALVFCNEGLRTLLQQSHIVNRPKSRNPHRPAHKFVDGAIVEAMNKAGWFEYVHNPSLIQHTGHVSSMGNGRHLDSVTFPGENFDAMELLK